MVQGISPPRELEEEEKPRPEAPEPTTEAPEMEAVRFEWPGLGGPEIVVYKPNQQAKPAETSLQPMPTVWLTPPRGAPWQYSGLTDGALAVKKFNYLGAPTPNEPDDVPTPQIHEHHHYGVGPNPPNQQIVRPARLVRPGYALVQVDNAGTVTTPPLPASNDYAMYQNNQRAVENGLNYYPQYGSPYNCPYYGENPNVAYPQRQMVSYTEVPPVDQHYHIHQHYYHPHHQCQSMNHHHHHHVIQPPRFNGHRPRCHHHHLHHHPARHPGVRHQCPHAEGFNWHNQPGAAPRSPYAHAEYDLSALRDLLGMM